MGAASLLLSALPCPALQILGPLGADVSGSIHMEPGQQPAQPLPLLPVACQASHPVFLPLLPLPAQQPPIPPSPAFQTSACASACLPARPPADGSFPNHTPNPEDRKAVEATRAAVLASGADLGIMLDTDVDRSGVVDRLGNGARALALRSFVFWFAFFVVVFVWWGRGALERACWLLPQAATLRCLDVACQWSSPSK